MHTAAFATAKKSSGFIRAPHAVHALDSEGSLLSVGPTVGVQDFDFLFTDQGGTNNLLPGREVTQTLPLNWPRNANSATVLLRGFGAEYLDDDHHLEVLITNVFFPDSNTVACNMELRDSGGDKPVSIFVNAEVIFFGA
ncbi:MAG TPA: hypothetical protein VGH33_05275 [Isosphaeraceae bacterium]